MTDWLMFPGLAKPVNAPRAKLVDGPALRQVRGWLWFMAAMVFLMVLIGGATRLTESGLSITEWKPVTGALPPLTQADWINLFNKYKQIPQYKELFPDMTLAHFKYIYFWEWGHRLHARMVGLEMLLPLIWFWARRKIPNSFALKLFGIGCLIGLQGLLGWYMVKSGLSKRVEVSQYLLASHLLLASVTYSALIWQVVGARPRIAQLGQDRLRPFAAVLLAMVLLQLGMGGLVAGLRAGLTYNTWPLMDGHFIPATQYLFASHPLWRNFFENVLTVQFQHRMMAYAIAALAIWQMVRARAVGGSALARTRVIVGIVVVQIGLGIVTLLLQVPLWAGLAHQLTAFVLLAMCVVHMRALLPSSAISADNAAARSAIISA